MLQSGIIELDVHSMNRAQAKTYIDSQLKRAKKDIYQIKVIHGYRGGTAIRDMVRKTYRNHPKVVRVEQKRKENSAEKRNRGVFSALR